jgi:hypothetical protein
MCTSCVATSPVNVPATHSRRLPSLLLLLLLLSSSCCLIAAKWHMTLVAFILGPPIALANAYGAGLTDQDNGANYATLALFLFAAWAGSAGNGIIAGCALMGVVMVCAVTASVLMQVGA